MENGPNLQEFFLFLIFIFFTKFIIQNYDVNNTEPGYFLNLVKTSIGNLTNLTKPQN